MNLSEALQLTYIGCDLDERGVLTLWLDRPERRNAMNEALVSSLKRVFQALRGVASYGGDLSVARVCVLRGRGGHFCAGGDIGEMREASAGELERINRSFGRLLEEAYACPIPLICVLEGAVMGGGFGLACVSDLNLALKGAHFALPEVRLGLIPAQIAPFVARRIGAQAATRLALTGERLDGVGAQRVGLVGSLFDDQATLSEGLDLLIKQFLRGAPNAQRQTKLLIRESVSAHSSELSAVLDAASVRLTQQATSAEGVEGLTAFLRKRSPSW